MSSLDSSHQMSLEGLSRPDWNRIHEAAVLIANATLRDDQALFDHHTQQLFNLLDRLEAHYGRNPVILATRADFTDDVAEAIALLKEAIRMKQSTTSKRLSLQSLVWLMIEGNYEDSLIEERLNDLRKVTDSTSEASDIQELQDLTKSFKKSQAE